MQIISHVNSIFSSNTYILFKESYIDVWIIDPGDTEFIFNWLSINNKNVKGVLLTHSHFDHIYGLNQLQNNFPFVEVFASVYAKDGLFNDKVNGSYYKEIPFVINRNDITYLVDGNSIELWPNCKLNVYETPGHGNDCLVFHVENNLFTGDSLIPGIRVFTKLKNGNKVLAEKSIQKILKTFDKNIMIWPGHEKSCILSSINL